MGKHIMLWDTGCKKKDKDIDKNYMVAMNERASGNCPGMSAYFQFQPDILGHCATEFVAKRLHGGYSDCFLATIFLYKQDIIGH